MLKMLLVLAAIALPGLARADPWTAGDTVAEVGAEAMLAADWLQTRQICANMRADPGDWREETNPVLGSHCQRVSADAYFALVGAGHLLVARLLPWTWARRVWQGATVAVEVDAVKTNIDAGFSVRW